MSRHSPNKMIKGVSRSLYHHTGIVPVIEQMPDLIRFTVSSDRVTATGGWRWTDPTKGWVWSDPELYVDGVRCLPAKTHQHLGEIIRDPDSWKAERPYVEPEMVELDRRKGEVRRT